LRILRAKRGVGRRKEDGAEKRGVALAVGAAMGELGGIVSRSCRSYDETAREGGPVFTSACDAEACLPKGGFSARIHSFASFEDLLGWAWDALQTIRRKMREQLPKAKEVACLPRAQDDIFPLPVSQASTFALRCTVGALNDLAGYGPEVADADLPPSEVVQNNLQRLIGRFEIWDTPRPEVYFCQVFSSKTLDYTGEEVKVAQRLSWSAVSPSLPEGVGCLPLEDFCRLGTLHYIASISPTTCFLRMRFRCLGRQP
jgi:hypothetical protein